MCVCVWVCMFVCHDTLLKSCNYKPCLLSLYFNSEHVCECMTV